MKKGKENKSTKRDNKGEESPQLLFSGSLAERFRSPYFSVSIFYHLPLFSPSVSLPPVSGLLVQVAIGW
jgi:hypothetical protein